MNNINLLKSKISLSYDIEMLSVRLVEFMNKDEAGPDEFVMSFILLLSNLVPKSIEHTKNILKNTTDEKLISLGKIQLERLEAFNKAIAILLTPFDLN